MNSNDDEIPSTTTHNIDAAGQDQQEQQRAAPSIPLVELELRNVTYSPITSQATAKTPTSRSTTTQQQRTTVLHDISTFIRPYQLSAWMGPSGSGKSSLISVAARLIKPADLDDRSVILVNGERGSLPKRLVGVVWQDDLLLSNLTVEENIWFAARLKSPQSTSDAEVHAMVHATMNDLGLWHVRSSLVGSPVANTAVRGISGGERKRVSVASELVLQPSLLFLDEPTSGLDATTAQALVSTLRQLADRGHAVSVVIHQPRTTIFQTFDHLLLLSKGRVVYQGVPSQARTYLESCPNVGSLPPETGIADWMMDAVIEDERRYLEMTRAEAATNDGDPLEGAVNSNKMASVLSQLQARWIEFQQQQTQQSTGTAEETPISVSKHGEKLISLEDLAALPKYNASFLVQFELLTRRIVKQQRGERLTVTAIATQFVYLTCMALFWWRLPNTTRWVFERNSLFFFMVIALSNGTVITAVTVFSQERVLLRRERSKKMYGVLSYFLAKTVSDMTTNVLLPVVNCLIVYWTAAYRASGTAFFKFALAYYLTISTAQSMGLAMSVAIPQPRLALVMAPAVTLFFMVLGGFYIPLENLHRGVEWASYLSFARYGYSAMLINEYEGREIPCDEDGTTISFGMTDLCPLPGDEVIEALGIRGVNADFWFNVIMLSILQVVFRTMTYVLLQRSK